MGKKNIYSHWVIYAIKVFIRRHKILVLAGGEGDDRGWDGWMASLPRWTWVWVNSGNWWWTGRPGVLRFMGSQRVRHDWATDLIWLHVSFVAQLMKNLPVMQEALVGFLGQEDPLEKGQVTHSNMLGLPRWLRQQRMQCGRSGFNPQVGKILWRSAW